MTKPLHIVCLDAPAPPDYGGAIDMYYKLNTLYALGYSITLHYFDYNLSRKVKELEPLCKAIYAYKRKSILQALPLTSPFIVQSRINKKLIQRLNQDTAPVLLEGLHCAGIIPFLQNKQRVVLRMHNEEAAYYRYLAQTEKVFFKKTYFHQESGLLQRYQQRMDKEIQLACLSQTDIAVFEKKYQFRHTHFIPCFLPWQKVSSQEGKGDFCLYHGNLSVSENEEAARWLIDNIFSKIKLPLTIAGKGISKGLAKQAKNCTNITLINNPDINQINNLVRDAHINVLPSMNRTGVKLKLLNALLNGRYCLTNNQGIAGSNIQKGIFVADAAQDWAEKIIALMKKEFTPAEKEKRAQIAALYNNKVNAEKLSELWSHYQ